MTNRRGLILGAAAFGTTPFVGCSSKPTYDDIAAQLRLQRPVDSGDRASLQRELVRCATLAPSSHNTQCWRFRLQERAMSIEPDLTRRCPAVDPDDHHLFVSLGCAAENLAQAALANGLQATIRLDPEGAGSIKVDLEPTRAIPSVSYQAIGQRQCTRGDYDGRPVSLQDLRLLAEAAAGPGVQAIFLTQRPDRERVLEHVVAANTAQMQDPAFVAELKAWIRFSEDEAERSGDGLYAGASGNLSTPRWLGSRMMDFVYTPRTENERYTRQIRNASGIVVFVADQADAAHWVEVGRCYERFALRATALEIRNSFVNQPVEVVSLRSSFASSLGLGARRPDLVVRFGRGAAMPWSLRRPVSAVLI